jgi:hypothetical protein
MGNNNNNGAVITLASIGFICLGVWWLESRFNAVAVMVVVGGILGVICFAGGALLNMANTRNVLSNLAEFNRHDAMTDRYRHQTLTHVAKGQSYQEKAKAQIDVLNEKRIHQLADQRSKLLMSSQQPQGESIDTEWWQAPEFEEE